MAVYNNVKESWYLEIKESLEAFCRRVDEKIDQEQQQLRACKKKNELESKLTQEMKLNSELKLQLAELNNRSGELERVCSSFESLTIAENDKNRLDNAKDLYQLAKELTGVRFDFSAPSNVAKGLWYLSLLKGVDVVVKGVDVDDFHIDWSDCSSDRKKWKELGDTFVQQWDNTGLKNDVKNEARRLLQTFELEAGDNDALWTIIRNAAHQGWPAPQDKENIIHNL